jgi:hypothetical protein
MIDEKTQGENPVEPTPVTPHLSSKEPKRDQPEIVLAGVGVVGAVVAAGAYSKSNAFHEHVNPPVQPSEPDLANLNVPNPSVEEKPTSFDTPDTPLPKDATPEPSQEKQETVPTEALEIGKPFQINEHLTGTPLDLNQNQKVDGIMVLNEAGKMEALALDQNENDVFEMMLVDTNQDGKADTILLDLDEDGTWDVARPLSTADAPAVALEVELESVQTRDVVVVNEHVAIPDCPPEKPVATLDPAPVETQPVTKAETVSGQHVTKTEIENVSLKEVVVDSTVQEHTYELEIEAEHSKQVVTDSTTQQHTYELEIEAEHSKQVVTDSTTQQHTYELEIEAEHSKQVVTDLTTQQHTHEHEIELNGETLHQRVTETVFVQEIHQLEIETLAQLDGSTMDDESNYDCLTDDLDT